MDLIGHIGQDCTVRDVTGSSRKSISFSVAHTEKYRDKQGIQQEQTIWVNCTLWKEADRTGIAQYLTKGTLVHVTGKPEARGYTGRDGQVKGDLRITVSEIQLLGSNNRPQQQPPQTNQVANTIQQWQQDHPPATAQPAAGPVPPPEDLFAPEGGDDLPF